MSVSPRASCGSSLLGSDALGQLSSLVALNQEVTRSNTERVGEAHKGFKSHVLVSVFTAAQPLHMNVELYSECFLGDASRTTFLAESRAHKSP